MTKDRVGDGVKKIRAEARKAAGTVKQAGRDLKRDAPAVAQEAKDSAEGLAKGVSRKSKELYSGVSKKLKDSKAKGW